MLPHLLVIGAQKAGTQSLTHYLDQHPQVRMCRRELNFFSDDRVWGRGVDWYRQQLGGSDATVVGETSPSYAMFPAYPAAPSRIAATLPEVRLVYVLRDPIERMRSSYQHALASGGESRPMREALLEDDFYLSASRYAMQIERYLDVIPADRLCLVLSDDLRLRRTETVDRVLRFAGVEPAGRSAPLTEEINVTSDKRVPRRWARALGGAVIRYHLEDRVPGWLVRMRERQSPWMTRSFRREETVLLPELRSELEVRLRPDVQRLRQWLGDDFGGWGLLD